MSSYLLLHVIMRSPFCSANRTFQRSLSGRARLQAETIHAFRRKCRSSRSEADRVIGLELGADDFLLKPISGRELVARVRVHLRRTHREPSAPSIGHWRMSNTERRIYRPDGSPVQLTSAEFDLLQMVATNPGSPVDRDALSRHVLRRPYTVDDRSLDNLVHQIRRKFGRSGAGEMIASIRNVGYVFRGYPED